MGTKIEFRSFVRIGGETLDLAKASTTQASENTGPCHESQKHALTSKYPMDSASSASYPHTNCAQSGIPTGRCKQKTRPFTNVPTDTTKCTGERAVKQRATLHEQTCPRNHKTNRNTQSLACLSNTLCTQSAQYCRTSSNQKTSKNQNFTPAHSKSTITSPSFIT